METLDRRSRCYLIRTQSPRTCEKPCRRISQPRHAQSKKTFIQLLTLTNIYQGLILTGPPGSGKSLVIDLWFAAQPTRYKVRKHYNQLILEIYRGVWEETQHRMHKGSLEHSQQYSAPPLWTAALRDRWRELFGAGMLPKKWARKPNMSLYSKPNIPQPTIAFAVAKRLILNHWLLVFDEIQLLDVSSATLLADVLSWFWRMGGVIVGTSNKLPEDLYKNGVQRDRLEPFVEALQVRCPVVHMRSEHDWREIRAEAGPSTWYTYPQKYLFEQALQRVSGDSGISSITHIMFH